MNLTELNNNIEILLKPYDNKTLSPRQQHGKDTITACKLMIHKLCEVIDGKDEALKINNGAYLAQSIRLKKEQNKALQLQKENDKLKIELMELRQQNEELKKNIEI